MGAAPYNLDVFMNDSLPMPVTALRPAQITAILNLVRRASRAEILPRFRTLEDADIKSKANDLDLVTEADVNAEKMIARGLLTLFPNALIVGEEACSANPDIIDGIQDAETAFTIDPVDGTWNFANGLSTFGVILSMTRFGKPIFGLHYDPLNDDAVLSEVGGRTEFRKPQKHPRTLNTSKGGTSLADLQGYLPLRMLPKSTQAEMAALFPDFKKVGTLGCSCHEYRMLAQGNVDFVMAASITPWDHAAGALLVQNAGGHVAFLDGGEYNAHRNRGPLLMASNEATWTALRDAFVFLLDAPEFATSDIAPE